MFKFNIKFFQTILYAENINQGPFLKDFFYDELK